MSAPAVLIQHPGFSGRGDNSKRIPDEENVLDAVEGTLLAAVEAFLAVVIVARKSR